MNYTENEILHVAKSLLETCTLHLNKKNSLVIALHGNLGSGKTSLTQHIAKLLGITESIQSPTFVIQKNYSLSEQSPVFQNLIHIDAYRIEDEKEMDQLNFSETLSYPNSLIIIEWPEQIEGYIPNNALHVFLDYVDQDSRSIRVEHKNIEILFEK